MNTADTTPQPHVAARSPIGCNRPMMAMVTDHERHRIEGIAQLEMRSLSATIRMLVLRGLEQYEADSLVAQ